MNYTGRIIKWNKDRGLLDKDFDMKRELAFTLSEELEMLNWKELLYDIEDGIFNIPSFDNHDDFAKWVVDNYLNQDMTVVDYLDKCIDQEVFNVGGMAKALKQSKDIHSDIDHIRDAVMTANECKPIGKVNKDGKQEKGESFHKIDPKQKIQEILGHFEIK